MTLKIRLFLNKTNYYWMFRAGPAQVTQSPPLMYKLSASSPGIFSAPGSCEPPWHVCSATAKNSVMFAYLSVSTSSFLIWLVFKFENHPT